MPAQSEFRGSTPARCEAPPACDSFLLTKTWERENVPLKGTLSGNYISPVTLTSATYADPVTVTGTISLSSAGINLQAASAWSIVNAGLIESPGTAGAFGISLGAGGYVENLLGGVIASNIDIEFTGAGALVNSGSLGGGTGVDLRAGGSVVNKGQIEVGAGNGVYLYGAATVTNAGAISNTGDTN
jgi:hypothetical protein